MVSFLFSAYFDSHFCYHSNDESQINTRILHLGYCINKLHVIRRIWWKAILIVLPHKGVLNRSLMHIDLVGAIRASLNRSMGCTPNLLMLKLEINIPAQLMFTNVEERNRDPNTYVTEPIENIKRVHETWRVTWRPLQNGWNELMICTCSYDHTKKEML